MKTSLAKTSTFFQPRMTAVAALLVLLILPSGGAGPVVCPFKILTALNCPACGLTRSVSSFLHFEFSSSIAYHPLGSFVTMFLFLIAITNRVDFYNVPSSHGARYLKHAFGTKVVVGVFLAVWFWRMYWP